MSMQKTGLRIRVIGDAVLRRKAKKLKEVTAEHRRLLSEMAQIMYDSKGVGLAAPQVGVSECLMVVDAGNGLYKLVNPKISKKQGSQCREEGCLSVPGVGIRVKRAKKILLEALDEDARPVCIEAEDLLACVFQHEHDHLEGKLIVDHASLLDKIRIKRQITRLKKQSHHFPPTHTGKKK